MKFRAYAYSQDATRSEDKYPMVERCVGVRIGLWRCSVSTYGPRAKHVARELSRGKGMV